MAIERRGYIDSPYGQVHYRSAGDQTDSTALILLHQTAWSSIQFQGVQSALARAGIRSIAPDTPGYGMSDGPADVPTIEDYADALAPLITQLDLARVVLVGHHTGSSIAAALAPRLGAQLAGVVMHAPSLYTAEERQQLLSYPHFDQTMHADGSHWMNRWNFAREATGGKAKPEATHLSVSMFFSTGATEWHGHHAVFNFDLKHALGQIDVPGLILSNTGDVSYEKTQRARKARPDFEYAELDGGTVYIVYEEPNRWSEPVIEFAQRVLKT